MTSATRAILGFAAAVVWIAPLAAEEQTPLDHLGQAERILSAVPQGSFKKDEQKQLGELRKHFAELRNSYSTAAGAGAPPATAPATDVKPDPKSDSVDWRMKFSEVEKDLASILAGVSSPSVPASDVRRQLEQFRLELELFFASATLGIADEAQTTQTSPNP